MCDNGIFSVYGAYRTHYSGDKEENVKLLTWEEILERLPEAASDFFGAHSPRNNSITFNDVRLTYFKLYDGDRIKYTPVWAFADHMPGLNGELDPDYIVQLLLVDAITGEAIDYVDNLVLLASEITVGEEHTEEAGEEAVE